MLQLQLQRENDWSTLKKVDVQARKSEHILKQVTTHLFENSSSLEEGAEPKLLDYSFNSDDDTHPCIYRNEPFKELYANESWIQCTEPSRLKWTHCVLELIHTQSVSYVNFVCRWSVFVVG